MSEGERRRGRKDTRERLRGRLKSNSSSDNQCTICLNTIRDLSFADCCLHPFCRSCIIEWSKRSNHCPVCRTVFDNVLTNVKSDSSYETIPIEPPPIPVTTIPLINIVRDIMVSQDGRSTLIRTRIINEDGTTEITESRGENEPSTSSSSPTVNASGSRPSSSPGVPRTQSMAEIEEIGRFMDILFRSLLTPDPFTAIAMVDDPTHRPTRSKSSTFPGRFRDPLFPLARPPPSALFQPRPMLASKRIQGKVGHPDFEWSKKTVNNPTKARFLGRFPVRVSKSRNEPPLVSPSLPKVTPSSVRRNESTSDDDHENDDDEPTPLRSRGRGRGRSRARGRGSIAKDEPSNRRTASSKDDDDD